MNAALTLALPFLVAIAVAIGVVVGRRAKAKPPSDLPGELLDETDVTVTPDRRLRLVLRRVDGKTFETTIDARHAHEVANGVILASAKARDYRRPEPPPPAHAEAL